MILAPVVYARKDLQDFTKHVPSGRAEPRSCAALKTGLRFRREPDRRRAAAGVCRSDGQPGADAGEPQAVRGRPGIQLSYEYLTGGAMGMSEPGKITLRPEMSEAKQFSVLLHEVAH